MLMFQIAAVLFCGVLLADLFHDYRLSGAALHRIRRTLSRYRHRRGCPCGPVVRREVARRVLWHSDDHLQIFQELHDIRFRCPTCERVNQTFQVCFSAHEIR